MTTPISNLKSPARDPLEIYLEQLEERDRREKRYKKYIDAYTALADKTAAKEKARIIAEREVSEGTPKDTPRTVTPDTKARQRGYYPSFGGKSSPTPPPAPADPAYITQLKADLRASNGIRSQQEQELKIANTENATYKATTAQQAKRIAELEKTNKKLEHRVANTTEEATRQRDLAREAQDEMLALQVEVNAKDKKLQKVEADNKMLIDRWMMEKKEDAERMNQAMEKGQKKR